MEKQPKQYKPGETISIRLSKKYTQEDLQALNELKMNHDRDFNSIVAPLLLQGIENYKKVKREVCVPLPSELSNEQMERFNNPFIKQLIGQIVFQLLENPGKPISFPSVDEQIRTEDKTDNEEFASKILEQNGFLDF